MYFFLNKLEITNKKDENKIRTTNNALLVRQFLN